MNQLHDCLEDNDVTHVLSTPALWKLLFLNEPNTDNIDRSKRLLTVEKLFLGGEALDNSQLFMPPRLRGLYNIYGVTECTIYQFISRNLATSFDPERDPPEQFMPLVPSVGWRLDGDSGELIDSATLEGASSPNYTFSYANGYVFIGSGDGWDGWFVGL